MAVRGMKRNQIIEWMKKVLKGVCVDNGDCDACKVEDVKLKMMIENVRNVQPYLSSTRIHLHCSNSFAYLLSSSVSKPSHKATCALQIDAGKAWRMPSGLQDAVEARNLPIFARSSATPPET
jgi:hypothetical protein